MSHINIMNKSGPRIELWGTPEGISLASQELKIKEPNFTFCLRLLK